MKQKIESRLQPNPHKQVRILYTNLKKITKYWIKFGKLLGCRCEGSRHRCRTWRQGPRPRPGCMRSKRIRRWRRRRCPSTCYPDGRPLHPDCVELRFKNKIRLFGFAHVWDYIFDLLQSIWSLKALILLFLKGSAKRFF